VCDRVVWRHRARPPAIRTTGLSADIGRPRVVRQNGESQSRRRSDCDLFVAVVRRSTARLPRENILDTSQEVGVSEMTDSVSSGTLNLLNSTQLNATLRTHACQTPRRFNHGRMKCVTIDRPWENVVAVVARRSIRQP